MKNQIIRIREIMTIVEVKIKAKWAIMIEYSIIEMKIIEMVMKEMNFSKIKMIRETKDLIEHKEVITDMIIEIKEEIITKIIIIIKIEK